MDELGGQIMMADVAGMVDDHRRRQYTAFVDKFKEAKTTDDCYTPQNVYDALADWVAETYGYDRERFMRPFKPGGDYQGETYPEGCAVVDNPPFSILSQIIDFYLAREIPFFLFGPTLTILGNMRGDRKDRICVVLIGNQITYENGAKVNTSYVTNMDTEYAVRIEPDLRAMLEEANRENERALHKELPTYSYPPEVLTGGAYTLARWGQRLRVLKSDCVMIRELDAQKPAEKAAAEKAAAEKRQGFIWELSERERRIQAALG